MDTPQETTLYGKLAKIMGEVKHIPKKGKNSHFNYNFATEGDISDAIRKLLSEHNVAIFASMTGRSQTASGNTIKTICDFEFTLACGDTGATHVCQWSAEANDNQDKGFNKAATAAMKYWLLKTFMIPTGEDPDADGQPDPKANKGVSANPKQRAPQQPPPAALSNRQLERIAASAEDGLKPLLDGSAYPSAASPQPAASVAASESVVDYGEIEKQARLNAPKLLENEAVVIYKATYQQTHNGMGAPCWIAYAHDINDTSFPITVWEGQAKWIREAGYEWPMTDSKDLNITVITHMVKGERLIKQVLKPENPFNGQPATPALITPEKSATPLKSPPDAISSQLPMWLASPVGECWQVLKAYLVSTGIYKNEHEMKNSFLKRGIVIGTSISDDWKKRPASELIAFLKTRHEQPIAEAS